MTLPTAGVDAGSPVPLYLQLEQVLLARLEAGEWHAGDRIPTETELCDRYAVSRVTVRQALARLVQRGLLTRGRGRGTFVRDTRLAASARSITSFSHELGALGLRPGARVLDVQTVEACADDAAALECEPGTPLLRVHRLRTADGQPIAVQDTLLLAELVPDLAAHLSDDVSLYQVLADRYGVRPQEASEVFRVGGVPAPLAELLGVARGTHAFHVVRVAYERSRPYERTTSVIRGDRYEIRLALRPS